MTRDPRFSDFASFYPHYLSEHRTPACRRLHFLGTTLALLLVLAALGTRQPWLVAVALVQGYALAWVGHFVFEKNRPATFRHPWWSLRGDWTMWWETLRGRRPF